MRAQTEQDKKVIAELKVIDREVRAHEQAHVAAAGGLVLSSPTYTYQYGPDGQAYAVGGEVSIDTSPGRTPEETIEKAQQMRAAALAPADPSGQDLVAAAASQLELQAKQELAQQQLAENRALEGAAPEVSAGTPQAQSSAESRSRQSADIYAAIAAARYAGFFCQCSGLTPFGACGEVPTTGLLDLHRRCGELGSDRADCADGRLAASGR